MRKHVPTVIALLVGATGVLPCCMVPATYEGSIGQDAQEAVLIHDGNREELVVRINYRITGDTMPDNFAWVITTPAEPDAYAVADEKLFSEMFDLAEKLLVPKPRNWLRTDNIAAGSIDKGVELGRRVQVGPYDIQPVRGVGPNALEGLNAWLKDHGFPTEDPKHMTYFVNQGFTFLCIRIVPPGEKKQVNDKGLLPPLHLSFESNHPYYPLMFSSRQGVFDVNIHLLTRDPLDYKDSATVLDRIYWTSRNFKGNVKIREKDMPKTLRKVFGKTSWKNDIGPWRYNNLRCTRVNRDNSISTWKEDIHFTTD